MTITAKVLADSKHYHTGDRLTTFEVRYPRFAHAEVMTHRVFSRNASSSRAIPVKKMIEDMRRDPAIPLSWGSNQPGMQAGAEIEESVEVIRQDIHRAVVFNKPVSAWLNAMDRAIETAEGFAKSGYHKQIVNRLLEPWAHITVVITSSDYENFFGLRIHKDALPEMQVLAEAMYQARLASAPVTLKRGQWHLPYVHPAEHVLRPHPGDLLKKSVARCARTSYKLHDGKDPTLAEDAALHDKLMQMTPLHASPAEHQAMADWLDIELLKRGAMRWNAGVGKNGNLAEGWVQYRKLFDNERITKYERTQP